MKLKKPKKWYIQNTKKIIQCDNENCDFTIELSSYDELFDYLNKECPVCHGKLPLLTEQDLFSILLINRILGNPIIKFINAIFTKKQRVFRVVFSRKGDGKFQLKEETSKN